MVHSAWNLSWQQGLCSQLHISKTHTQAGCTNTNSFSLQLKANVLLLHLCMFNKLHLWGNLFLWNLPTVLKVILYSWCVSNVWDEILIHACSAKSAAILFKWDLWMWKCHHFVCITLSLYTYTKDNVTYTTSWLITPNV